jgi:hypothetical protein
MHFAALGPGEHLNRGQGTGCSELAIRVCCLVWLHVYLPQVAASPTLSMLPALYRLLPLNTNFWAL